MGVRSASGEAKATDVTTSIDHLLTFSTIVGESSNQLSRAKATVLLCGTGLTKVLSQQLATACELDDLWRELCSRSVVV